MIFSKPLLIFFVFSIALSFPIAVITSTAYLSIISYLLILLLISSKFFLRKERLYFQNRHTGISWSVYLLLSYIVMSTLIIFIIDRDIINFLTIIFNFLLPAIIFWYFINQASSDEFNMVLKCIVIAGIGIGLFMLLENYYKLGKGYAFEYSYMALDYSVQRMSGEVDNLSGVFGRINNVKSFGPLTNAATSAAWLAFSYFGLIALIDINSVIKKYTILIIYSLAILFTLNFQSIIAFFIVIFIFEFKRLLTAFTYYGYIFRLLSFLVILSLIFIIINTIEPVSVDHSVNRIGLISKSLLYMFSKQFEFLFGLSSLAYTREYDSIFELLVLSFDNYILYFKNKEILLLTGVGFGPYSYGGGSDAGVFYILSSLGILIFILLIVGISILLYKLILLIYYDEKVLLSRKLNIIEGSNLIKFSVSILLFSMIGDLHYSIWYDRSVIPIIFFSLAIIHVFYIKNEKLLNNKR